MKSSRRSVLKLLSLLACCPIRSLAITTVTEQGKPSLNYASFVAYLDTLIPADGSPAASGLNVPSKMVGKARSHPALAKAIVEGIYWLDEKARLLGKGDFSQLAESEQIALVSKAEQGNSGSVEGRFFRKTRNEAFFIYYAQPSSWLNLSYPGPPQPLGFMDHTVAPEEGYGSRI